MLWCWIQAFSVARVDVRIISEVFANRVSGDVLLLRFEVLLVSNSVFVIARVPNFPR